MARLILKSPYIKSTGGASGYLTLGSRIIVPRDKFMEWIDEQAVKKSEIL